MTREAVLPSAGEAIVPRRPAIKALRERRAMTQRHLADAAEVSVRTVMRAEQGKEISSENLRAICAVLQVDAAALPLGGPALPSEPTPAPASDRRAGLLEALGPWLATGRWMAKAAAAAVASLALTAGGYVAGGMLHLEDHGFEAKVNAAMSDFAGRDLNRISWSLSPLAGWDAAKAEEHRRLVMEGTRTFAYMVCNGQPSSLFYADCEHQKTRLRATRYDRQAFEGRLGPLPAGAYKDVLRHLTADPSVTITAALVRREQDDDKGLLWFDPRVVSPHVLPTDAGFVWLAVRIMAREEYRR